MDIIESCLRCEGNEVTRYDESIGEMFDYLESLGAEIHIVSNNWGLPCLHDHRCNVYCGCVSRLLSFFPRIFGRCRFDYHPEDPTTYSTDPRRDKFHLQDHIKARDPSLVLAGSSKRDRYQRIADYASEHARGVVIAIGDNQRDITALTEVVTSMDRYGVLFPSLDQRATWGFSENIADAECRFRCGANYLRRYMSDLTSILGGGVFITRPESRHEHHPCDHPLCLLQNPDHPVICQRLALQCDTCPEVDTSSTQSSRWGTHAQKMPPAAAGACESLRRVP